MKNKKTYLKKSLSWAFFSFLFSNSTANAMAMNLIDLTHGVGSGSFELSSFVDGGSISAFSGPNYMGLAPGDTTTITSWSVGGPGDGVDWLIQPTFRADTGVHSVDLQHTTASSISTVIPTVSGEVYDLSFSAAAVSNYDGTGTVTAGPLVEQLTAPFSPPFGWAGQNLYTVLVPVHCDWLNNHNSIYRN